MIDISDKKIDNPIEFLVENATSWDEALRYIENYPHSFDKVSISYGRDRNDCTIDEASGLTTLSTSYAQFAERVKAQLNEPAEEIAPAGTAYLFLSDDKYWRATVNKPELVGDNWVYEANEKDTVLAQAISIPASADWRTTLHSITTASTEPRSFQVWRHGDKGTIRNVKATSPAAAVLEFVTFVDKNEDFGTFDIAYGDVVAAVVVQSPSDGRRTVTVTGQWEKQSDGVSYAPAYEVSNGVINASPA